MIFQTRTQDTEVLPSFGAHLLIMASRVGLQVGIDEGFGSDERSGLALFNDLRRYQAVLIAFPFSAPLEPYVGIGGGFLQAVGVRVDAVVQDPQRQAGPAGAVSGGLVERVHDVDGWHSRPLGPVHRIRPVSDRNRAVE